MGGHGCRALALALALTLGRAAAAAAAAAPPAAAPPDAPPTKAAPRLTRPPQVLEGVEATYPAAAMAARIQGDVQLAVDLDAEGQVQRLEVLQSPDEALAAAAVSALLRMRFSPAHLDEVPAAVRFAYTFHFALPAGPQPEAPPRLDGRVVVEGGGPVAGATLRLTPGTTLAQTDADGRFALALPRPGRYTLSVSGAAIEGTAVDLAARADETVTLTITVKGRGAAGAFSTTVRGRAPSFEISRQQLSRDELRAVPGAFGDPLRVLEALPGLGRSPFASGILVMRGSSPDDSLVFLDGHPMPLLYHFGGGPSVVPPEAIGELDLAPGGFAVRYGRATAGIVEVVTRPGHADAFHAGAHVSVLDAGATADGPLGTFGSFRLAARRSYIDVVLPVVAKIIHANTALSLTPRYYDALGRADVDVGGHIKLSLLVHGSDDTLSFAQAQPPFGLPSKFALHTAAQRINPRLVATLGPGLTLEVSPLLGTLTDHGQTPYAFSSLDTATQALRCELVAHPAAATRLAVGLDLSRQQHAFAAPLPAPLAPRDFPTPSPGQAQQRTVPGRLTVLQTAVYAEANVHLGPLQLLPAARLEHAEFVDRALAAAEPRLTARLRLAEAISAKGSLGLYHRLPLPDQLAPLTGNPELAHERSWQSALGLEVALDQAHSLDVQAYYKAMDTLTLSTGTTLATLAGPLPQRYANSGSGRAMGLEVLLRRRLTRRLMGWVAYSLSLSQRRAGDGLPYQLYVRDQTHNLNVLVSVALPWHMNVGGRMRYVSGYPTRPIDGAIFDIDSGNYIPQAAPTLSDRLPAFAQLDLRLDRTFGDPEGFNVLVYLDIQNVTNRQNAEYYQYSQDYSQRYAYPGLPFLPSLGVEARF